MNKNKTYFHFNKITKLRFREPEWIGSLSSKDCNGNENVTWKKKFGKWWLFCDYCIYFNFLNQEEDYVGIPTIMSHLQKII